jgi:hypothetical protein
MPLISDPPTRKKNQFHPPPPEFTSINTPLPPDLSLSRTGKAIWRYLHLETMRNSFQKTANSKGYIEI